MIPGRDGGVDADNPRRAQHPRRHPRVEPVAQSRTAEMHQPAAQAWNVEALGGAVNRHRPRRDLRRQCSDRNMRAAVIDQVAMDLVGHDDPVALDRHLPHRQQFIAGENPPGGVLRIAQHQDLRARIANLAHRIEVQHVAIGLAAQILRIQPPPGVVDGGMKRRIGRQVQQHAVAGIGKRPDGRKRPLHQVGQRLHHGRVDLPAEARLHPARKRARQALVAMPAGAAVRIAVFLLADQLRDGAADRMRDRKIHLRHPGRQHVRRVFRPLDVLARAQHVHRDLEAGWAHR